MRNVLRVASPGAAGAAHWRPNRGADLSKNTTAHLIQDIERLREHLGIARWDRRTVLRKQSSGAADLSVPPFVTDFGDRGRLLAIVLSVTCIMFIDVTDGASEGKVSARYY